MVNAVYAGADNRGTADNSTVFNSILAAYPSGNLNIFIPCGVYRFDRAINAVTASNVAFNGEAYGCVTIRTNDPSITVLTLSGQFDSFNNLVFRPAVRSTSPQVNITGNCFQCSMVNNIIEYGGGISFTNGTNTANVDNLALRYILGSAALKVIGTSASPTIGPVVRNLVFDNPWPQGTPNQLTQLKAWTPGQAMNKGDAINNNGAFYQASAACTTAGSGSGPSGYPSGTSPELVFSNLIVDGSCQWNYVAANILACIIQDSYSYSFIIADSTCINGAMGFVAIDSAATGTSYPKFDRFQNLSTDSQWFTGTSLDAGVDFRFLNGYHSGSKRGNGFAIGTGFTGGVSIVSSRISGSWLAGVQVNGGTDYHVDSNTIGSNGNGGANSNIEVAAGVKGWSVTNNNVGADPDFGGNNISRYGVSVGTGASDYYTVTGNFCRGVTATGTCVSNGGTGTHQTVSGNW